MKSFTKLTFIILSSLGLMQACGVGRSDGVIVVGGGGSSGGYTPVVTASSFVNELNVQDPQVMLHGVAKNPATDADYFVFYDASIDEYVALDIDLLQSSGYTASEAADAYIYGDLADIAEVVDPDSYAANIAYEDAGYGEIFYEGLETGYLYEDTQGKEMDMLYAAKVMQEVKSKKQGSMLAEQYGLSEKQGIRLAAAAQNWSTLSESREMTNADANAMSKDLFGIDFSELASASQKAASGDMSEADRLIEKAASSLETTEENVRSIMGSLVQ